MGIKRKKINLYGYQKRALSQLGTSGKQLLCICPGGGKTKTAIEYIRTHTQFKKILILAHGQNVLKSQWIDELNEVGEPHSAKIDNNERITVSLPQSFKERDVPEYDLIVVDEAHEFYFAEKLVQRIIKANPKACQLLLTGTPSKFNLKGGFNPIIVPATEVYKDGRLSNAYIGLVRSTYKVIDKDFNQNKDLKASVKLGTKETAQSFEILLDEMLDRLRVNAKVKDKANILHAMQYVGAQKYQAVFGHLGKTMIAAKDIEHAKIIYRHLKKRGVGVSLSDSKSDVSSKKVRLFLEDSDVKVLIVIRRGILGFNMPELINVVDFTMSRNVDRVYQLFARVLRKHENLDKYYFRMCSYIDDKVDEIIVAAALMMASEEFISAYNGKNLKDLKMIILKKKKKKKKAGPPGPPDPPQPPKFDADLVDVVLSVDLFSELIVNPKSKLWREYKKVSYGEVMAKVTGKEYIRQIKNITEENLDYFDKHGVEDERIYG